MNERRKVIIVGSGPAGYTAAIYAARAELMPLMIAGSGSDNRIGIPGGQLMLTTEVENYPGFPEGISGPEIMDLFRKQAERFGCNVRYVDATKVDMSRQPFRVETSEEELYETDALIIATGAAAKWLGLESEQYFQNRGVSACATCDGALYRSKPMAVVGGGDTAMEEALFLTRFASKVTVIHRRDQLRASKIMQERAFKHEKINFIWDSEVCKVVGNDAGVTGVQVRNRKTGEIAEIPVEALFIAIGHQPNTQLFSGQLAIDSQGYLVVETGTRTSVEGVFAAGDVTDSVYRQAVTAAGTGCAAAIDAERWLAEREASMAVGGEEVSGVLR